MRKGCKEMRRFDGKKVRAALMLALLSVMLVGCKPSDEKLAEAEGARDELVKARDKAEESYLDLTTDEDRAKLDELSAKVDEVMLVDFLKMSDKKIDEYLPTVTEIASEYSKLQGKLDGTYDDEEAQRQEAAKHGEIECYLVNKAGANLTSIKFHDVTADTFSENVIGEGVVLSDGYTMMGVMLPIYSDSDKWEFVATDEDGKEYIFACPQELGELSDGVSITLEYDVVTEEGTAKFGSYVDEEDEEEAESAEAASEGST